MTSSASPTRPTASGGSPGTTRRLPEQGSGDDLRLQPVGEAAVGDLLGRADRGDTAAWVEIVRRYERLVWAVARSYRLDTPDAADVVQTTWLRLVEHLGGIHDAERLGGWLATTTRREALRLARSRRRQLADGADDEIALVPAGDADVDEALLRDERDAVLHRAVRALEPRCQRLLRVLSASPPPRYDTVAEALGMPIGSIGPTRGRCLQRLRSALGDLGWSDLDGVHA